MRQVKPREKWHIWAAKGLVDWQVASALLVGPGANSYLWVRRGDGIAYMQGQETLRSLARAILRTVPPRKRKGRP